MYFKKHSSKAPHGLRHLIISDMTFLVFAGILVLQSFLLAGVHSWHLLVQSQQ